MYHWYMPFYCQVAFHDWMYHNLFNHSPVEGHLGWSQLGLLAPWWLSGKESAYQCRRYRFDSWSRKIPHATEQLSPCTTTIEACAPRAHALQQEKPLQWEVYALQLESNPRRPQLEKSPGSNKDPAQPKRKKIIFNNFIFKKLQGLPRWC